MRPTAIIRSILSSLICICAWAAYADEAQDEVFDQIATELLGEFARSTEVDIGNPQAILGFFKEDRHASIAVWPFNPEKIPVPRGIADRWTRLLENALARHKPASLRLVTRNSLKTLVQETSNLTQFEQIPNPAVELAKSAKVSALVIGDIYPYEGAYRLSFQIVAVNTGSILASSREYTQQVDIANSAQNSRLLTLDLALESAVKHFLDANLPIETLQLVGVREARTKSATDFGDYVTDRFSHSFSRELALRMPDFRLMVKPLEQSAPPGTRSVNRSNFGETSEYQNSYRFEGSYWDLGNWVDLRLNLINSNREQVAWSAKVNRQSIPPILLDLTNLSSQAAGGLEDRGPFGLTLSTNKGNNPRFDIGEEMTLWVSTAQDAYITCFYIQADGLGFKIFPNQFVERSPVSPNEKKGWIAAGESVEIPGRYASFKFEVQPPKGREDIHCFATSRDVAPELPVELGQRALEPIEPRLLDRLTNYFRELDQIRVSEARMTISIR